MCPLDLFGTTLSPLAEWQLVGDREVVPFTLIYQLQVYQRTPYSFDVVPLRSTGYKYKSEKEEPPGGVQNIEVIGAKFSTITSLQLHHLLRTL